ncbi:MAG: arginine--tRNA ligase [Acidimicrobiales bacterium]|nr:arginine--tRNA ligase [Acidimicrobiales bacterium]
MDVRGSLIEAIQKALLELTLDLSFDEIKLERPANPDHGDWSTNVALAISKTLNRNPRDLASEITAALEHQSPTHVEKIEIAGPGFINFKLEDSWLHDVLTEVVDAGIEDWARHQIGGNQKVIVEFVSANPTGPLHAGHGRGACLGDSVARLYQRCGYSVQRDFYINDRGTQMKLYVESLAAKASDKEIPVDGYKGEYIQEWAAEMPQEADPFEWGYQRALRSHRETLEALNIYFDNWFSERSMVDSGAIEETLADLRNADAVFDSDGAVWLRSTNWGDDKDRVLVKSNGEYTYLLPDVAYHRNKFERAEALVNVWGADHHGYINRMHAAMSALGHKPEDLKIAITQMVRLQRGGQEVKLSKRTGDIVELSEVIEEVGSDAARFTYLLLSVDSSQNFDLELVAQQVNENPVFYVQYAHARIHSIMKKSQEAGITRSPLSETNLSVLNHPSELAILRSLQELPTVVLRSTQEVAPHRITNWSRDFASLFHSFYHDCRVFGEDIDSSTTQARLWLAEAARIGLVISLDLLGVSAPTEMWRDEEGEEING